MIETFAALLMAHTLADFVFQTGWMVRRKRNVFVLLLHMIVVLVTAGLALGRWDAPELLALAAAHLAIDAVKTYGRFGGIGGYLADQIAHVATLAVLAVWDPGLWQDGLWALHAPALPHGYALVTGAILATRAGGFAVGLLMARYRNVRLPAGLKNGGALIGQLERGLIYLFVLVGNPAGIGFLIAAKSILRFDTASKNQRAGEYVIIGTLASFGWALLISYAIVSLRAALPPLEIGADTP